MSWLTKHDDGGGRMGRGLSFVQDEIRLVVTQCRRKGPERSRGQPVFAAEGRSFRHRICVPGRRLMQLEAE